MNDNIKNHISSCEKSHRLLW